MKINTLRAEMMVPLLKCLLYSHDNLSLEWISMDHYITLGVMVYTCNHSTGEIETRGSLTSLASAVSSRMKQ